MIVELKTKETVRVVWIAPYLYAEMPWKDKVCQNRAFKLNEFDVIDEED
jgi:hypothetical protein